MSSIRKRELFTNDRGCACHGTNTITAADAGRIGCITNGREKASGGVEVSVSTYHSLLCVSLSCDNTALSACMIQSALVQPFQFDGCVRNLMFNSTPGYDGSRYTHFPIDLTLGGSRTCDLAVRMAYPS